MAIVTIRTIYGFIYIFENGDVIEEIIITLEDVA